MTAIQNQLLMSAQPNQVQFKGKQNQVEQPRMSNSNVGDSFLPNVSSEDKKTLKKVLIGVGVAVGVYVLGSIALGGVIAGKAFGAIKNLIKKNDAEIAAASARMKNDFNKNVMGREANNLFNQRKQVSEFFENL